MECRELWMVTVNYKLLKPFTLKDSQFESRCSIITLLSQFKIAKLFIDVHEVS